MDTMELEYIRKNIEDVEKRVERACAKSGRKKEEVTIIAVSKTVDLDKMIQAYDAGMRNFGENRVQELREKYDNIHRECIWHLIGHLQTNKVKYIIDKVNIIHSIDRKGVVEEIQKRAEKIGRVIEVLVQVNIAEEDTKFGLAESQVLPFIKEISSYKNIKVKGLMTIAPYVENPEQARPVFQALKKLFVDIKKENIDNIDMEYLSMGMSNDFEVAIEEGANMVRIGTSIFGKRHYR